MYHLRMAHPNVSELIGEGQDVDAKCDSTDPFGHGTGNVKFPTTVALVPFLRIRTYGTRLVDCHGHWID